MPNVLRFQGLVSRYAVKCNIQPKTHTVYIKFDETDFKETITYCDCKSGGRTAGGCSHSVAILTYIYYQMNDIMLPEYHPYAKKVFDTVKDVRNFKKRMLRELSTDESDSMDLDYESKQLESNFEITEINQLQKPRRSTRIAKKQCTRD